MGIRTIRHSGLKRYYLTGDEQAVGKQFKKALRIMDMLAYITSPTDCQMLTGFHELKGRRKGTYAVTVTGNWRITFKWDGDDVFDLNLEDYH